MRLAQQTWARTRASRHSVQIPCQLVRLRDFKLVGDRIIDLSSQGMLVGPTDPVMTGEELIISFKAPGSDLYIDAEVEVSRVMHGRRPHEQMRALGLSILKMGDWERFVLEKTLRPIPIAPPRFRPGRRDWSASLRRLLHPEGVRAAAYA